MLDLGAHVSAAGGVDKAIDRAVALNMDAVQIFTKNANQWAAKPLDPAVVDRFREKRAASNLRHVVAHDSYLINVASPDDVLWEKSIEALRIELDRCDILGVQHLVSHPGAHMDSGVEAGIARVAAAIDRIHAGLPDGTTSLAIETTAGQGTTLGSRFEEIAAIIDAVEDKTRVSVCLDTCHIYVAGYDISTKETFDRVIEQFDAIIGLGRLSVIHLNDTLKGLGSRRDRHAHIGDGELGREPFGYFLRDPKLDGLPGILETPKEDDFEDDRRNLETLRSLVADTESEVPLDATGLAGCRAD
jgi:deoxyribonuclease IV